MGLKGNDYYLLRTTNGRERKYTPARLLKIANEYFDWVLKNPLKEQQLFHYQGSVVSKKVNKMRPFTLEGFCNYADIVLNTFKNYEKTEITDDMTDKARKTANDFLIVTARIRQVIDNQQFEGAAAGLLNQNIIASKLGLLNRVEHQGNSEKPISMVTRDIIIQEHNGE